jgi:hypothetical protein
MEGSMRVFGLLPLFLSMPLLAATEFTTKINDIDYGQKAGDEVLVFLENGKVAKLRENNQLLVTKNKSINKKDWFRITMDDERFITSVEEVEAPVKEEEKSFKSFYEAPQSYVPTTIASMSIAQKYHKEARYNPKDSQCFNRAQVWTYEWWKKHSLKSMKILIFFSRTYIRRYNFEWWFHIAPYVHIMENGKVVERVMDIKYTNGPRDFQKWANIFLRNDHPCPVITKYSQYADHPYTGECYFQRTHMYTYQPADLQMYEAWDYKKTNWNMTEVRWAYEEAYDESI